MNQTIPVVNHRKAFHRTFAWTVIGVLLFLRIPFSVFITYAYPSQEQWGPAIYQVGTYFLTVILIYWERDVLLEFHIDGAALALIILLKPAQTLLLGYLGIVIPLTFPNPAGLLIWAIAICTVMALWRGGYRPGRIKARSVGWLSLGLLIGITLSVLPNIAVFRATAGSSAPVYTALSSVTASTGTAFLYQLGFAAVSEEPLFRGFLWGALRHLGWREVWVWLAQAALFMSAHLYFKDAMPMSFWVVVPAAGLILGRLAWSSRSIVPGMLAHAAYNAGAYVVLLRLIG